MISTHVADLHKLDYAYLGQSRGIPRIALLPALTSYIYIISTQLWDRAATLGYSPLCAR